MERVIKHDVRFDKRGFKDRLLSLFKPFDYEYKRNLPILDAVFFPQHFLAATFLTVFVLIIVAYEITIFCLSFIDKYTILLNLYRITNLVLSVKKGLNVMLASAVTSANDIYTYEFSDSDLSPYFSLIDVFANQLLIIQQAIRIAFMYLY